MDYYKVINQNISGPDFLDISFVGRLHEDCLWDVDAFMKLVGALTSITKSLQSHDTLPRELCHKVVTIYGFTLNMVSAHHNPSDLYVIKNADQIDLRELIDDLGIIVEDFFSGIVRDQT